MRTDTFHRDGYIVLPSLFSPETIDSAKEALLAEADPLIRAGDTSRKIGSPVLPKEAVEYEASKLLILSDDLIEIVRNLLNSQPIYFGDSGVSFGDGYTGWHRDNRRSDRSDGTAPDWKGEYDLVRVGIYLQDCAEHSGGLLIRAGSHKNAPPAKTRLQRIRSRFHGKARFVDTRKGDVVIWSLRSIHAGHAVRLKFSPRLLVDPKLQPWIPDFIRVPLDGFRMAIFATFARNGQHYDRYKKYIVGRDYFANRPRAKAELPATVIFDPV